MSGTAIRNDTIESDQIVGPNIAHMFTIEVKDSGGKLRKDGQVAGEYAKLKGKRKKRRNFGWRVGGVGGLCSPYAEIGGVHPPYGTRRRVALGRCSTARDYSRLNQARWRQRARERDRLRIPKIFLFHTAATLAAIISSTSGVFTNRGAHTSSRRTVLAAGARCWSALFGRLDGQISNVRSLRCPLRACRPAWAPG